MDKTTIKSTIQNISSILGFDNERYKNSSFFFSEDIEHNITEGFLKSIINKDTVLSDLEIYQTILIPVIQANPEKHWKISSIYRLLAISSAEIDQQLSKDYFELYFRHYILSKYSGVKNVEDVSKFYLTILTRESCCNICKAYNEIYKFDLMLLEFPYKIKKCEYLHSCRATISVITENRYNAILKRGY